MVLENKSFSDLKTRFWRCQLTHSEPALKFDEIKKEKQEKVKS